MEEWKCQYQMIWNYLKSLGIPEIFLPLNPTDLNSEKITNWARAITGTSGDSKLVDVIISKLEELEKNRPDGTIEGKR